MAYQQDYIINGMQYTISGTEEDHNRIQDDPDYAISIIDKDQDTNNNFPAQLVPPPQNNNQNIVWNRSNTLFLLEQYNLRKEQFRDPKKKKKDLWAEISKEFQNSLGVHISVDNLMQKYRNLMRTFRKIKDNNNSSGRNREDWEFFDIISNITNEDKTVNFGPTVSSLNLPPKENTNPVEMENISIGVESNSTSIKRKLVNVNDSTETLSPAKEKRTRGKKLFEYRKKQQDIEEKRVHEIICLRRAIEKSNEIQERRNMLFEQLIKMQK